MSWLPDGDIDLAQFITAAEAAKRLGVTHQRVAFLLASGRLSGYRHPAGGRYVWRVHHSLYLAPKPPGRPARPRKNPARMRSKP